MGRLRHRDRGPPDGHRRRRAAVATGGRPHGHERGESTLRARRELLRRDRLRGRPRRVQAGVHALSDVAGALQYWPVVLSTSSVRRGPRHADAVPRRRAGPRPRAKALDRGGRARRPREPRRARPHLVQRDRRQDHHRRHGRGGHAAERAHARERGGARRQGGDARERARRAGGVGACGRDRRGAPRLPRSRAAPSAPLSPPVAVHATPAAPGSSAGRGPAIAAFGVAIAAAATGSVFGALVLHDKSRLESECTGRACAPGSQPDIDAVSRDGTVSTVAFGVAAAGLVVGTLLWLTEGGSPVARSGDRGSAVQAHPVRFRPGFIGVHFDGCSRAPDPAGPMDRRRLGVELAGGMGLQRPHGVDRLLRSPGVPCGRRHRRGGRRVRPWAPIVRASSEPARAACACRTPVSCRPAMEACARSPRRRRRRPAMRAPSLERSLPPMAAEATAGARRRSRGGSSPRAARSVRARAP